MQKFDKVRTENLTFLYIGCPFYSNSTSPVSRATVGFTTIHAVQPLKCQSVWNSPKFLNYSVSYVDITPLNIKMKAVSEYSKLETLKQLCSFLKMLIFVLGLCLELQQPKYR